MNKFLSLIFGLLILSASMVALADPVADKIKLSLTEMIPGVIVGDIRPSAVPGLYEVVVGTKMIYVTKDVKHMFTGDLIDLTTRTNISEAKRGKLVAAAIDEIGEKNMIVMGPVKPKRTLTVFTDVDCPYCVKLHEEVAQLNAAGIKVRYLLYPRNGQDSQTYKRSVAVWCAKDRVKAVGIAKAGGELEMKTCTNPVSKHYDLGRSVGVNGTPTLVLDDGEILVGYIPYAKLISMLGLDGKQKVGAAK